MDSCSGCVSDKRGMRMIEIMIDYAVLTAYTEQYLMEWLSSPFSYGLLMGAVLEILGYGIFKAVSLLNIK